VLKGGEILLHSLKVSEDFGEPLLLLFGESHDVESTIEEEIRQTRRGAVPGDTTTAKPDAIPPCA
jgi:hypothetical protein